MLAVVLSFVPGSCEWLYSTRKGFITLILVFLVFFVGINYFAMDTPVDRNYDVLSLVVNLRFS